jgi:hypothetical protein
MKFESARVMGRGTEVTTLSSVNPSAFSDLVK